MHPSVTLAIEKTVKKYFEEEGRTDWVEKIWTSWDNSLFFHIVNGRFRVGTVAKDSKQDFLDEVRTLEFKYLNDPTGEMQFIVDVETTLRKTSFMKQLKDEDENTFTHIQHRD